MPKKTQTDPDLETGSVTPPRRTTPVEDISPAETFNTALTSPSGTFDSVDTPQTSKVAIEHHVKSSSNARSAGLLLGMTNPAIAIAGLLFLGVGGAAAFGWFQIPGLNTQIKELEEQVNLLNNEINRLSSEVDRLGDENDRFQSLNDQLNATVEDFEVITDDLNSTVLELEDVASGLNTTNQELEIQVEDLSSENANYAKLNRELNTTASQLALEVNYFEGALRELIVENGILSNLTLTLEGVTAQLGNLTLEQNETLELLQNTLDEFVVENDRLEALNNNLVNVVTFLNDTSLGLDNSLQQITGYLAEQIEANQVILLENIENSYRQKASNWDCDYRDFFREESFGIDFNEPITNLDDVLLYVNGRVLSEICLDVEDFEAFLANRFQDVINSHRFIRAVQEYTTAAIDYYFPEAGEVGLSAADWGDASFRCKDVAPYRWQTVQ